MASATGNFPQSTAAINWFDSNGQLHIRIYSTDGYTVTERCIDSPGTWYDGSFSQPGSAVSAMSWNASDGTHIRVYCTFEDTTTEWCSNPGGSGWTQGSYTPG